MKKKIAKKTVKPKSNRKTNWVTQPDVKVGRGLGSGKGNPRKIETPELLWELFEEYKTWSKATPYKQHAGTYKGKKVYIDKERVLTFIGFEGWLCEQKIVYDLSHYEGAIDYRPMIKNIKKVCSNDTVTGASAGVYNANIASRLEGLTEKQAVEVNDKRKEVGDMFPFGNPNDKEQDDEQ